MVGPQALGTQNDNNGATFPEAGWGTPPISGPLWSPCLGAPGEPFPSLPCPVMRAVGAGSSPSLHTGGEWGTRQGPKPQPATTFPLPNPPRPGSAGKVAFGFKKMTLEGGHPDVCPLMTFCDQGSLQNISCLPRNRRGIFSWNSGLR